MRKRWIAVILAGLLSLTGSAVGAEELTGNIVLEKAPEERIDDTDFSEGQIFLSDSESKESALVEDDLDEPENTGSIVGFSDEEKADCFENELLSDGEVTTSFRQEQTEDLQDLPGTFEKVFWMFRQMSNETCFEEEDLFQAGVSYNKAAAHAALKNHIENSPNETDGQKFIGIKLSETNIVAVFWDADVSEFEFYYTQGASGNSLEAVNMIVPYGMPGKVEVYASRYLHYTDNDPYGVSKATIASPASYKGTETLKYSYIGFSDYSDTEVQKLSDNVLQAGFKAWNELVRGEAGETLQSLGFSNYGTSVVTTLSKPVITGYYNSTKGGDIRWSKVPNAAGYYIYRNRAAEGGNKLIATIPDGNTTQYYDEGIKSNCWGRVYSYTVVAFNGSVKSAVSTAVTLQRLAPMKFTGYRRPAAGAIDLKWACTESSNKAVGYELQYALSTTDLYNRSGTFAKVSINGRNNLMTSLKGLKRNGKYYFRIRCYVNYTHSVTGKTTKTWSQYSNVVSVTAM